MCNFDPNNPAEYLKEQFQTETDTGSDTFYIDKRHCFP